MNGASLLLLQLFALSLVPGAGEAEDREPALIIEQGSQVGRQVVALGRDLLVAGATSGDVAAVSGDIEVSGRVGGDLIVLGGDARIAAGGQVVGDAFVLGGRLETEPGSEIGGRSVSYPTVGSAWVLLLGGPSLGQSPFSGVVVGAKLALVTAWLAWSLLLFATGGREVLSVSEGIRRQPFRCFFAGLTGVLALFLTALFFSAFAAVLVGVPLLALAVLIALLLKLWGMVAVFHALGQWVVSRLLRRRWIPLNAALVGLLLLGTLKLLPWVGAWVWTAATLIGVGATLLTKFGRREPWFVAEALPLRASL